MRQIDGCLDHVSQIHLIIISLFVFHSSGGVSVNTSEELVINTLTAFNNLSFFANDSSSLFNSQQEIMLGMDGQIDKWTDGWMDGQTDGQTDGWMDGQMDGRMDGWMDERTDGRTDGWMDGQMDGWMD